MELRITKHADKAHTLLYRRDDGTETWMKADEFFVRHDLSHYALEKTLGYHTAFMGMLNAGMDIKAFENRSERRSIALTDQAVQAENMANLFLMEQTQGQLDDFNGVLSGSFKDMGTSTSATPLTAGQLDSIRSLLAQLLADWKAMEPGQTITLEF